MQAVLPLVGPAAEKVIRDRYKAASDCNSQRRCAANGPGTGQGSRGG
ncbi:MAG: hypothetical protein ACQESR_02235 [Planctomycetota bacterium]